MQIWPVDPAPLLPAVDRRAVFISFCTALGLPGQEVFIVKHLYSVQHRVRDKQILETPDFELVAFQTTLRKRTCAWWRSEMSIHKPLTRKMFKKILQKVFATSLHNYRPHHKQWTVPVVENFLRGVFSPFIQHKTGIGLFRRRVEDMDPKKHFRNKDSFHQADTMVRS